jgi:hypothetical protein
VRLGLTQPHLNTYMKVRQLVENAPNISNLHAWLHERELLKGQLRRVIGKPNSGIKVPVYLRKIKRIDDLVRQACDEIPAKWTYFAVAEGAEVITEQGEGGLFKTIHGLMIPQMDGSPHAFNNAFMEQCVTEAVNTLISQDAGSKKQVGGKVRQFSMSSKSVQPKTLYEGSVSDHNYGVYLFDTPLDIFAIVLDFARDDFFQQHE